MWPKYLGMLAKLDTARVGRGEGTWINKCCLMCRDPSELESQQFLSQFFDLTVFCRRYDPEDNTAGGAAGEKKSDGGGREGGWGKRGDFFVCYQKGWGMGRPAKIFSLRGKITLCSTHKMASAGGKNIAIDKSTFKAAKVLVGSNRTRRRM